MKRSITKSFTMVARISGLIAIGLGIVHLGAGSASVSAHTFFGVLLVGAVWALAVQIRSSAIGLAFAAGAWGFILPALGMAQLNISPGPAQWALRAVHVLVGITGIALAEIMAKRLLTTRAASQSVQASEDAPSLREESPTPE
ncbi:MAG: hypothetical protein P4L33_05385 [Capsulimonadaceae bacterium]|nr:hypothetical protein [Capsulimonadaceae bacterium]